MQNSRTTSTDLHQLLRKRILTLDLAPGTKLSENSLCDEYQEGRPRVRDVLARLGVEGCVMVLPQSGTFVTLLLQSNIRQIARARTLIGQRIIREVCDKGLSETQMAELYDVQLASSPDALLARLQARKDRDADLPDRRLFDPRYVRAHARKVLRSYQSDP